MKEVDMMYIDLLSPYKPEKYLNVVTNREIRSILTRFRMGLLSISINMGRTYALLSIS